MVSNGGVSDRAVLAPRRPIDALVSRRGAVLVLGVAERQDRGWVQLADLRRRGRLVAIGRRADVVGGVAGDVAGGDDRHRDWTRRGGGRGRDALAGAGRGCREWRGGRR